MVPIKLFYIILELWESVCLYQVQLLPLYYLPDLGKYKILLGLHGLFLTKSMKRCCYEIKNTIP